MYDTHSRDVSPVSCIKMMQSVSCYNGLLLISGLSWAMTWAAFTTMTISAACYILALTIYKPPSSPSNSNEKDDNSVSVPSSELDEKHDISFPAPDGESAEKETKHGTGAVNSEATVDGYSNEAYDGMAAEDNFSTYL